MTIIEVKPLSQRPLFDTLCGLDVVIVNPSPDKTLYIRVRAQSLTVSRRKPAAYGGRPHK